MEYIIQEAHEIRDLTKDEAAYLIGNQDQGSQNYSIFSDGEWADTLEDTLVLFTLLYCDEDIDIDNHMIIFKIPAHGLSNSRAPEYFLEQWNKRQMELYPSLLLE